VVDDGGEAEYQREDESRSCKRVASVNAFLVVLMISWEYIRITVEEIVQSLIVRIHGKAYGLDIVDGLEGYRKVWRGVGVETVSRGQLFLVCR